MRTLKHIALFVVFITGMASKTKAAEWSHATKDDWPTLFPDYCAGKSQSPIDLDSSLAVTPSTDPGPIIFNGYDTKAAASLYNGGHGVVFAFDSDFSPFISGGRLPAGDTFQFLSLHWHWGSTSSTGSEHTIDGKQFPLELHIIHWNDKYGNVSNAIGHKDGLAVLGFMYEVSSEDNKYLTPLVDKFPSVALTRTEVDKLSHPKERKQIETSKNEESASDTLKSFCEDLYAPNNLACPKSRAESEAGEAKLNGTYSLNQFLPSTGAGGGGGGGGVGGGGGGGAYFYYSGGLTTPKCNEVVLWTNFVTKNKISESQLAVFRSLKDGSGNGTFVMDNYRDPQPLNGRTINFRKGSPSSQTWVSCGCHEAKSCSQCGRKPYMCNGECTWSKIKSQCVKVQNHPYTKSFQQIYK